VPPFVERPATSGGREYGEGGGEGEHGSHRTGLPFAWTAEGDPRRAAKPWSAPAMPWLSCLITGACGLAAHRLVLGVTAVCAPGTTRLTVAWRLPLPRSDHAAALDQADQDDDDGSHQQDVDQATHGGGGGEPEHPEHEQHDDEGPEHDGSLQS